jgi:uncharacterized protein (DUF1697 family)
MTKYVAFLRGINVGKAKRIEMAELKRTFEGAGLGNVTTYIASGNVFFETPDADAAAVAKAIKAALGKRFGFPISVIVRAAEDIRRMVDSDPFKGVKVTPETRLYVTLLSDEPKGGMSVPWQSPQGDFEILRVSDDVVFSVLTLGKGGTTDAMKVLEKEFGKKVTTRNWNVITKLAEMAS